MANPYHARVQQKLSHCRLLLGLLDTTASSERQTGEALLQAAALHLAIGFRLYLRELASALKLADPERVRELADLQTRKANAGIINELAGLPFNNQLFSLEQQLLSPKIVAGPAKALIAKDVEAGEVSCSAQQLSRWLLALESLAERQRQAFVEW